MGYRQPSIRTGYEYIIPFRTSSMFSKVAEENGQVVEKTDDRLDILYDDGKKASFSIGKVHGRAEGTVYLHSLVSDFNKGDKFKKNDILYYNENFFEKDWLSNNLVLKMNRVVTVALAMTNEVFEDSSAISSDLSKIMSTPITKEYSYIIEFNKNMVNLVSEGSEVEPETVLFTILEEGTDYSNLSENTIALLQGLTNFSPKAKVKGVIDRFEVRYNGDMTDMSPTLKKIATKIERQTFERTKGTEYELPNCQVSSEYRVDGKNLLPDTLEFKVYIRFDVTAGIGDKGVFGNQLKSVVSDVFNYGITTETGDKVDALFSYKSIANRITLSPLINGILNRILRIAGKRIASME